jgi:rare lipoprotein A
MKSIPFRTAQNSIPRRLPPLVQASSFAVLALSLAVTAPGREAASLSAPHIASLAVHSAPKNHHPWREVGTASWYGAAFQGRRTANGERFDMTNLTCAHPTLPMGTWIKVTNLHNRRIAFVRVNDRGPMVEDRIVDLSLGAAHVLRLHGVGRVRLEALAPTDPDLIQGLLAQVHIPLLASPLTRPAIRLAA